MNNEELDIATRLLTVNILDRAKQVVPQIAKNIMVKFNNGPKPNLREKAQVVLNIEVEAKAMYEIENRVQFYRNSNNRPKR